MISAPQNQTNISLSQNNHRQKLQHLDSNTKSEAKITELNKQLHQVQASLKTRNINDQDLQLVDDINKLEAKKEIQAILDILQEPKRKKLLIFDIDGTIRVNEMSCESNLDPDVDHDTFEKLKELHTKSNFDVNFLTARERATVEKHARTRFSELPCYLGYGREFMHGKKHKKIYTPKAEIIERNKKAINLIEQLLVKFDLPNDDSVVRQYDDSIIIQLHDKRFVNIRDQIFAYLTKLLPKAEFNFKKIGPNIILFQSESKFTKADGLEALLADKKDFLDSNTDIVIFGDTETDYAGMKRLKELKLPKGARAFNVAVGPELKDKEGIDFNFKDYHSTEMLINILAKSL